MIAFLANCKLLKPNLRNGQGFQTANIHKRNSEKFKRMRTRYSHKWTQTNLKKKELWVQTPIPPPLPKKKRLNTYKTIPGVV
jgi:hypothetical protein